MGEALGGSIWEGRGDNDEEPECEGSLDYSPLSGR